jgi:hypothetical protein
MLAGPADPDIGVHRKFTIGEAKILSAAKRALVASSSWFTFTLQ